VYRNDEFDIDELQNLIKYCFLRPGVPEEAGLLKDIIRKWATKSILGVCLGQQAIGGDQSSKVYPWI
jgi:anthranilate synthase component 2